MRPNKGKGKAAVNSLYADFQFNIGKQGFVKLCNKLTKLQSLVQDALSIASMENRLDVIINKAQLSDIDTMLTFLHSVVDLAEKSIVHCPPVTGLPPYPALGIAWTALVNNRMTIDLDTAKAIHALVNSITIVTINKGGATNKVPVPNLPGIFTPADASIRPQTNKDSIALLKVSIKNHPLKERIIDLVQELNAAEPKHIQKHKNARDYLLQVKTIVESSQTTIKRSTW